MAKTRQGAFEKTYHHIDAPTYQDDEYGREHKRRILINPPRKFGTGLALEEIYRTQELAYIRNSTWSIKRKLDGENIRIYWDGEQALWNGKSNKFQCSAEFQDYMNSTFIEEIFEEKFGREKEVYIYGEKMGPKTQGNELGLDKDEVIIFDVEINGTFLGEEGIRDVAGYFGTRSVYDFMDLGPSTDINLMSTSLEAIIDDVATNEFGDWEGVVCSPTVNIKDHNGKRIIVKIKNKDYNKDWRRK